MPLKPSKVDLLGRWSWEIQVIISGCQLFADMSKCRQPFAAYKCSVQSWYSLPVGVQGTVLGYIYSTYAIPGTILNRSRLSSRHTFTEPAQFLQDLSTAPACHYVFAFVLKNSCYLLQAECVLTENDVEIWIEDDQQ